MASVPPALWRVRTPRKVWAVGVASGEGGKPGMLMGEIKLAQQVWILGETETKFALLAKKREFWGVLIVLGEFCPAWALVEPSRASFFSPVG